MDNNLNLKEIKEILPHGAIKEISNRSGIGYLTVLRVLNGQSSNLKVLNTIVDYAQELKKTRNEISKRVQRVLA